MNENKNTLVSIIIPVYNDAEFLHESLDSAVNQTLKNIEIICVNDGSTDNSLEIMNEYAAKDKRVHIVNKTQNAGLLMARKDGIMAAQGDFTMFLDGDDYLVPNACETAYNLIVKNDVDILNFSFAIHELAEDGNVKNIQVYNPEDVGKILCSRDEIQSCLFLKASWTINLCFAIFTTKLLKLVYSKVDIFYCFFGEDRYLMYYLLYYVKKMKMTLTEPLYIYYRGKGITTNSEVSLEKFEQNSRQRSLSAKLIKNFLEREGTFEKQKKYFLRWRHEAMQTCFGYCNILSVKVNELTQAVKILYRYWNEKEDVHEIILYSLRELRNHINWAANLEKTNKNLIAQMNDENKNARIKELQDWSKEQFKAKEWFLSQIKYKDERIAELEKVSGFCYKILTKIFRILRGKIKNE